MVAVLLMVFSETTGTTTTGLCSLIPALHDDVSSSFAPIAPRLKLDLESDVSPSAAIAPPLMLDTQSDVSPSDVCKLETLILSRHFIIVFRV
jgi:hypothetical protein